MTATTPDPGPYDFGPLLRVDGIQWGAVGPVVAQNIEGHFHIEVLSSTTLEDYQGSPEVIWTTETLDTPRLLQGSRMTNTPTPIPQPVALQWTALAGSAALISVDVICNHPSVDGYTGPPTLGVGTALSKYFPTPFAWDMGVSLWDLPPVGPSDSRWTGQIAGHMVASNPTPPPDFIYRDMPDYSGWTPGDPNPIGYILYGTKGPAAPVISPMPDYIDTAFGAPFISYVRCDPLPVAPVYSVTVGADLVEINSTLAIDPTETEAIVFAVQQTGTSVLPPGVYPITVRCTNVSGFSETSFNYTKT